MTKLEEEAIIRLALSKGCWLVADIDYKTSAPTQITKYEEYERARELTRLFFILHQDYSRSPLEMRESVKEGKSVFFLLQRNGGPTIDFLSSVEFSEGGHAKMNPGFLAHHKTYWNQAAQRNEVVPAALAEFYKELCETTKKLTEREKIGARIYWMGRGVRQLIDSGKLKIGIIQQPDAGPGQQVV